MKTLDTRASYDLWADVYPAVAHNPLMAIEQEIVESILMTLRPHRALDVGTGSGRYLPILVRAGAAHVVGADFSMAMLRRVAKPSADEVTKPVRGSDPYDAADTQIVCADARRLPFQRRSFDLVNASLTVGDVADLNAWVLEMARVLERGGHIVYSDFHPSWTEHGWSRTFRDRDGETHELAFAGHTIDHHLTALEAAGLRIAAIREPRFKDTTNPDVKTFRRRWGNPPVVVVFHAIKPL